MVVKFYDISVVCLGYKHKQLCSRHQKGINEKRTLVQQNLDG